jgi:hypothetical protein
METQEQNLSMVSIKICDVPHYLHSGWFYLSTLENEEGEAISVPSNVLKSDISVRNNKDLYHLCISCRYWIMPELPLSLVEYLLKQPKSYYQKNYAEFTTEFAIQFPILKAIEIVMDEPKDRVLAAVKSGFIDILTCLHQRCGHALSIVACCEVADMGRVDMLDYFHTHVPNTLRCAPICICALRLDQHAIVEYLLEKGVSLDRNMCHAAVSYKALKCTRILHSAGYICNSEDFRFAVSMRWFDGVKFLHGVSCSCESEKICAFAADVEILKYLHQQGYPLNQKTLEVNAANGYLANLTYAHQQGVPLTEQLMNKAAAFGHLEILQYLHEHNCAWSWMAPTMAKTKKHWDCFNYLRTNGCPMTP